ncbi:hypothetical protein JD844_005204 [Phrynosoma platyrhinos]|uniref:MARCKS-related protein n=1 Tax=Phrynosoma platyrhinos TaxID=52577 RepID=A0ABQ7TNQ7_PHRPL|nr:hypothetical protein JD844_005204 [Phrynosoma platyrhinos]
MALCMNETQALASSSPELALENGHVKINGDVSPKADGEATPLNGNGSAEPVKEEAKGESGSGDAIEPAPVAEGGEAKADGSAGAAASKETPKKKKKFSFKKSFKLSGISFRKAKKESSDASAVSSPGEEQGKAEAKGEENLACASTGEAEQATKEEAVPEEKVATPAEASAPEEPQEEPAQREGGSEGPVKEEEEKQQPAPASPPSESQEDTKPAEAEASAVPAEQKEE